MYALVEGASIPQIRCRSIRHTAPVDTLVLVVAGLVAIVAYYWIRQRLKSKRSSGIGAFARRHGLKYSPGGSLHLSRDEAKLFQQGIDRGFENLLTGTWQGVPIRAADYWYLTESTNAQGETTKSKHYFSMALTELTCSVPHVAVARPDLLTRMAGHLGGPTLEFESERFNRSFKVTTYDQPFAFKLVDAQMIEYLLGTTGSFIIDVTKSSLIVHTHRLRPAELELLLDMVKGFRDHIPRLVWTEYGSGPPPEQPQTEEAQVPRQSEPMGPLPPPPPRTPPSPLPPPPTGPPPRVDQRTPTQDERQV